MIHYESPVGNVLAQLEQFWIVPKHVCAEDRRHRRQGAEDVPPGAPPADRQRRRLHDLAVREEGNDGVQALPGLLRPAVARIGRRAHVLHELRRGHRRPEGGQHRLGRPGAVQGRQRGQEGSQRRRVVTIPGAETTNITWNSNPAKPKNRELLEPAVKKALSMCVDRDQIIDVVFAGYATKVESIVGHIAGASRTRTWGRSSTTARRPTRRSTSSATRGARTASASSRRRPARTPSRRTRCSTRSSRRPRPTSTSIASSTSSGTASRSSASR